MKMKVTDGVVKPADLLAAIEELRRGHRTRIMKRLWATEPDLARYIDGVTGYILSGMQDEPDELTPRVKDALLDFMITIVRAMEIGHFRLWRDTYIPTKK